MENYLVLNGQKIELTPEQYQEVCNAVSLNEKSPFDRREKGEAYWFIGDDGFLCATGEQSRCIDNLHHGIANYCSNKELMASANYETFERILWRFSEENGGGGAYFICYDKKIGDWAITNTPTYILLLGPTFCSKAIALRAIEEAKKWLCENYLKPEDVFF